MSNYYLLSDKEYKTILKNLNIKNYDMYELKNTLEYQHNKLNSDNDIYVLAAKNYLSKNMPKLYENEEIVVDEDANVSVMEDGAYVQCWVWVENNKKKIRKHTK